MVNTKELVKLEMAANSIARGNLACPGCSLNANFKHTLSALENKAIVVIPACCTSVIQGAGDGYGMKVPIVNTAFGAAAAVASGIKRKLAFDGKDDIFSFIPSIMIPFTCKREGLGIRGLSSIKKFLLLVFL